MPNVDAVLISLFGSDPIIGTEALRALLAIGDQGEDSFFGRPIPYPRTTQVKRRVLQYVASRKKTIVPRLLARLDNQAEYGDAHAIALLCAGTDDETAGNALYSLLERGYDNGNGVARFQAWGNAGGSAWTLWQHVKGNSYQWEKLHTFAFRGACAAIARSREGDIGALEDLITHQYRDDALVPIDASPDASVFHQAVSSAEISQQAVEPFLEWRRGAVADAILQQWPSHRHTRVRHFGADILASLGFRRTVTPIVNWLAKEPIPSVRASLIHALERTDVAAAADAALDFFASSGEGGPFVARCAWQAEDEARAKQALSRIASGGGVAGDEALVSLARLGVRHKRLMEALESHSPYSRINAAIALAYLHDVTAVDRITAMLSEASTPLERAYLIAALSLLGQTARGGELHSELVAAASADYPGQVDLFRVHRFLQRAILDALAAAAEAAAAALRAWATELEPLPPNPGPMTAPSDRSRTQSLRHETPSEAIRESDDQGRPIAIRGRTRKPATAPQKRKRTARRRTDVLFITVNDHETRALLEAFKRETGHEAVTEPIGDRFYRDLGTVNGTNCMHALSEMGTSGPGGAHETVAKGIRAVTPDAVIFIGIAFGVNEQKQKIGDILLSKQLRLYELQRVGTDIILRGDKPHSSTRLVNYFNGFAQTSWEGATVRQGVVLSGDKLIDNVDYRDQLRKLESEAIGGEMEGAGLYVACQDAKVDWIVLKAICDWADGEKAKDKDTRQQEAAANAVAFLMHALTKASLRRSRSQMR